MKLSNWREEYHYFSGKLSDVNRQLAFAGIALVWIFNIAAKPVPRIPEKLLLPVLLLVLGLTLDLLHYIYSTGTWGLFHRYHESRRTGNDKDPDIEAPIWLNWPSNMLFWGKVLAIILAYAFIFHFVWSVWRMPSSQS